MDRRHFLELTGATAIASGLSWQNAARGQTPALPAEIRIGYQKSSQLAVAKQKRLIETRFGSSVNIRWVEFTFGPPLLEALGAGKIDYGYTGDAPPIFAQAAHAPLRYVAALKAKAENNGIVVPQTSSVTDIKGLKGKTVGAAKGSSAHDLLVASLESVGLALTDIKPVYLAPADAASTFATGGIDAWSIWDPFLAIAELTLKARRVPIDPAIARQNSFYLANGDFVTKFPQAVAALNEEAATAAHYILDHHDEAAALFSAATGVPIQAETLIASRGDFSVVPVSEDIVREQQAVADRFARIKLIPAPVNVAEIVWSWTPRG